MKQSTAFPFPWLLVVGLWLIVTGLGGCASTARSPLPYAKTSDTVEIFLQPPFGTTLRTKLAVLPFKAPAYAANVARVVTEAYYQEVLRNGGFRQVNLVLELPPNQSHLAPWQVLKDFDLVLEGEITYVLGGTGSSPTQLQVEVRMVDVSRGTMTWYVKQQCTSQPGQDLDLIWSTVPGEPAESYQNMAVVLARKFVQVITTMPEGDPHPGVDPRAPGAPSSAPKPD